MRIKTNWLWFSLLLSLVAFAGFGCGGGAGGGEGGGGGETTAPTSATGEVIKTITVKETSYSLDPVQIKLEKAGTYVFKANNEADIEHALKIEGNGIEKETGNISGGDDTTLKVNLKPGTYDLYCPIEGHKALGMDGEVRVAVEGGADTGGGSESDASGDSGGGY